jgi:phosphoglycerate dehydrogenase-like enzyme
LLEQISQQKHMITIGFDSPAGSMIPRLIPSLVENVKLVEIGEGENIDLLNELDGLVTSNWFPRETLVPKLQWIHVLSAGVDHVPAWILDHPRWKLTHGSGPGAVPIAEWCLGMMLFHAHRFGDILAYQAQRSWYQDRVKDMTCSVLRNATVGILGYGIIGRELARLCHAFGMKIHASLGRKGKIQNASYITPGTGDSEGILPESWFSLADFQKVAPQFDFIVLGLRVTPATRHIINAETLERFKPTSFLINPARGALIDESALIEALKNKQLGGAALDVYSVEPLGQDDPLRDAPNIILSPHCSPESNFYRQEMILCIQDNIQRFASNHPLLNVIGSI